MTQPNDPAYPTSCNNGFSKLEVMTKDIVCSILSNPNIDINTFTTNDYKSLAINVQFLTNTLIEELNKS